MNKQKLIVSSAYATIITIIFAVVVVIWAELSTPMKDWLKNFSGHHWTSKSIFSVLTYAIAVVVLYLLPYQYNDNHLRRALGFLFAFTVLGTVVFTLFFTGHHFQLF